MATTLVDINKACSCKVRVINPFPTVMSIKQDAVIGRAEPLEGNPIIITNEEDSSEVEKHVKVRQIKLATGVNTQSISEYTARKVQAEKSPKVPFHLADLYEKTTQELSDEQKQRVAQLLGRLKDNFSRDERDLGLTHITSHANRRGSSSQATNKTSPDGIW